MNVLVCESVWWIVWEGWMLRMVIFERLAAAETSGEQGKYPYQPTDGMAFDWVGLNLGGSVSISEIV